MHILFLALLFIPTSIWANDRNDRIAASLRNLADQIEDADLDEAQEMSIMQHVNAIHDTIEASTPPSDHAKCIIAMALKALGRDEVDRDQMSQFVNMICSNPEFPAGSIYYPNGQIAYVAGHYSDKGSWKYPNGQTAYQDGNYSDRGSWKYPDGQTAYQDGNYSDRGSWKYPDGQTAYQDGNYSDRGSYKYKNGNSGFVWGNYSDKGSYKYPNGQVAFQQGNVSGRNNWYYPTGNIYKNDPNFTLDDLITIVEKYTGKKFRYDRHGQWPKYPDQVKKILTFVWIEDTLI